MRNYARTVMVESFHGWWRPRAREDKASELACKPGSVTHPKARRRPSICDRRCRRPGAVYPQTRAGRPQTSAQRRPKPTPLDLAPGGVYRAAAVTCSAGGLLHHRFTLTAWRTRRRSTFCCTVPRVTPGGRYPPPCPVEPGLSSTDGFPPTAAARPTRSHPQGSDWPHGRPA